MLASCPRRGGRWTDRVVTWGNCWSWSFYLLNHIYLRIYIFIHLCVTSHPEIFRCEETLVILVTRIKIIRKETERFNENLSIFLTKFSDHIITSFRLLKFYFKWNIFLLITLRGNVYYNRVLVVLLSYAFSLLHESYMTDTSGHLDSHSNYFFPPRWASRLIIIYLFLT